jgi:hypothetical protein
MQNSKKSKSNKKVKMTLLLDSETLDTIRDYGESALGITSISAIVRVMAKEYAKRKQNKEW